jgi:hypothetical protein
MTGRDDIRAKIERSSFGTRDARQARAGVTDADARKVVSRAAAYPKALPAKKIGG